MNFLRKCMLTLLGLSLLAGCGTLLPKPDCPETARCFLLRGHDQPSGFGLYSYLLFGDKPTESSRERYLAALSTYLDLEAIEDSSYRDHPEKLNITLLPLLTAPGPAPLPERLLKKYDYARARAFLRTLPDQKTRNSGPYLISTTKPLDPESYIVEPYLYQDLTLVPRDLIQLWVRDFKQQAAKPRFWEKNAMREMAKTLRTTVAILAQGLPDILSGLGSSIQLVEDPK
ncbi:hypothetical protein K8S19_12735 [bacterium]|nr:hypothetical protein [bacterium]